MSEIFKVELSRARAIAICVCGAGAGVLLFVAGAASGLLLATNATGMQIAQAAPAAAKYEPMPVAQKASPAAAPEQNALVAVNDSDGSSGNPPSLAALAVAPQAAAPPPPSPATAPTFTQPPTAPANPIQSAPGFAEASATRSGQNAEFARSGTGYGLPLAVKVCSFSGKAGADQLAALLDSNGYRASVVRAFGAQGRVWYVVTVGPYNEWDAAANAAARVAVLANVQPVVGQFH